MNHDFVATTASITVGVRVFYLEDESKPDDNHYVWAYRVTISNGSPATVQLLRRTWRITDAYGRVLQVEGEGVVGEQPVLEPGESFEYTSGTPLGTASGFMTGSYHMIRCDGREEFDIKIPTLILDCPQRSQRLH